MVEISVDDITAAPVADLVARASSTRVLDAAEEAILVRRRVSGHDAALDALVRSHLRIAVDEAIRNRGLGERQDRLVRAAAQALVEAAPRFDPAEHGSFGEYARRIVRNAIKNEMVS